MRYIKEYNEHSKLLGYHVTFKHLLPKIMEEGLKVNVPEDFGENGDIEGVYLFKTIDDAKFALYQWFGDRIEEMEEELGEDLEEVCLEVDLTGLESYLIDSVDYEWICTVDIPSEKILNTFEI